MKTPTPARLELQISISHLYGVILSLREDMEEAKDKPGYAMVALSIRAEIHSLTKTIEFLKALC